MGPGAYIHFVAFQSVLRRGHGHHDHDHVNASVSVLRRSHENENEIVSAVSQGVRVLQLHPLTISLSRRCLRSRVSAAASSLPPRGIYAVANERCANATEER
jgi:hypothetical protein